jgi:hypothetical protein
LFEGGGRCSLSLTRSFVLCGASGVVVKGKKRGVSSRPVDLLVTRTGKVHR